MTQANSAHVKLEEIKDVELGAEGVRVSFVGGERKFVEGTEGFDLYRRRMEWKQESRSFI